MPLSTHLTMSHSHLVLELIDAKDEIEGATNIKMTTKSIITFQELVAKPFIAMVKTNISS